MYIEMQILIHDFWIETQLGLSIYLHSLYLLRGSELNYEIRQHYKLTTNTIKKIYYVYLKRIQKRLQNVYKHQFNMRIVMCRGFFFFLTYRWRGLSTRRFIIFLHIYPKSIKNIQFPYYLWHQKVTGV